MMSSPSSFKVSTRPFVPTTRPARLVAAAILTASLFAGAAPAVAVEEAAPTASEGVCDCAWGPEPAPGPGFELPDLASRWTPEQGIRSGTFRQMVPGLVVIEGFFDLRQDQIALTVAPYSMETGRGDQVAVPFVYDDLYSDLGACGWRMRGRCSVRPETVISCSPCPWTAPRWPPPSTTRPPALRRAT